MIDVTEILKRLRLFHEQTGMALNRMARGAELHPNSLNRLFDMTWQPRPDTLSKLERWINEVFPTVLPREVIPLEGEGWEIIFDLDGWWVRKGSRLTGPFARVREAHEEAVKETKNGDAATMGAGRR